MAVPAFVKPTGCTTQSVKPEANRWKGTCVHPPTAKLCHPNTNCKYEGVRGVVRGCVGPKTAPTFESLDDKGPSVQLAPECPLGQAALVEPARSRDPEEGPQTPARTGEGPAIRTLDLKTKEGRSLQG